MIQMFLFTDTSVPSAVACSMYSKLTTITHTSHLIPPRTGIGTRPEPYHGKSVLCYTISITYQGQKKDERHNNQECCLYRRSRDVLSCIAMTVESVLATAARRHARQSRVCQIHGVPCLWLRLDRRHTTKVKVHQGTTYSGLRQSEELLHVAAL